MPQRSVCGFVIVDRVTGRVSRCRRPYPHPAPKPWDFLDEKIRARREKEDEFESHHLKLEDRKSEEEQKETMATGTVNQRAVIFDLGSDECAVVDTDDEEDGEDEAVAPMVKCSGGVHDDSAYGSIENSPQKGGPTATSKYYHRKHDSAVAFLDSPDKLASNVDAKNQATPHPAKLHETPLLPTPGKHSNIRAPIAAHQAPLTVPGEEGITEAIAKNTKQVAKPNREIRRVVVTSRAKTRFAKRPIYTARKSELKLQVKTEPISFARKAESDYVNTPSPQKCGSLLSEAIFTARISGTLRPQEDYIIPQPAVFIEPSCGGGGDFGTSVLGKSLYLNDENPILKSFMGGLERICEE